MGLKCKARDKRVVSWLVYQRADRTLRFMVLTVRIPSSAQSWSIWSILDNSGYVSGVVTMEPH
jgi:hypothetical protein